MKISLWEGWKLLVFIVKCFFLFTVGLWIFDEERIYQIYLDMQNTILGE